MAPEAAKTLRRLSRTDRERLQAAIDRLPDEGNRTRMVTAPGEFRLRVGDWRVRFTVDRQQRVCQVLTVKPRGDAYK